MNTKGIAARGFEEGRVEEQVPPEVKQVEHVPQVAQGDQVRIVGCDTEVMGVPLGHDQWRD